MYHPWTTEVVVVVVAPLRRERSLVTYDCSNNYYIKIWAAA
jgi:hypothetical protein